MKILLPRNVTMTWNPSDGFQTSEPNPETKTLETGGMIEFIGVYESDLVIRIRRFLLSIDNDPAGLDANSDSNVDIADIIFALLSI